MVIHVLARMLETAGRVYLVRYWLLGVGLNLLGLGALIAIGYTILQSFDWFGIGGWLFEAGYLVVATLLASFLFECYTHSRKLTKTP